MVVIKLLVFILFNIVIVGGVENLGLLLLIFFNIIVIFLVVDRRVYFGFVLFIFCIISLYIGDILWFSCCFVVII